MSEFKSNNRVGFGVLLIIAIIILSWALFFDAYKRHLKKPKETHPHILSVYTVKGDTLDTRSEHVEDSCEVDVWTLEKNGWRRR